MRVYVAIPTHRNFGRTIGKTLEALAKQTYRDFKVLIAYKPFPGDKTLGIVDKFRDKLDIEIIIQNEGYFEEALNLIYRNADGDLLITTDDDAIPELDWVRKHIQLHKQYPRVAVIGGKVISSPITRNTIDTIYTILSRVIKSVIGFYKPLFNELRNYVSYYNDMGFFVYGDNYIKKDFELLQTMWIIGANMSVKRATYEGFELPCSTIRGLGNESLLSLHAILKGFKVLKTSAIKVIHLERESLSRPKDVRLAAIEEAIFPYNVYRIYGHINIQKLKLYLNVIKMLYNVERLFRKQFPILESRFLAVPIALQAIEEDRLPKWIRSRLELLARRIRSI